MGKADPTAQQVLGMLDACRIVVTNSPEARTQAIDSAVLKTAGAILVKTKTALPDDVILQATEMHAPVTWIQLLTIMEIVAASVGATKTQK